MGQLKNLKILAASLIHDPPQSHSRIKTYLDEIEVVDFREYQVIENKEECRLVNFYAEQASIAIEITDQIEDEIFGEVNIIKLNKEFLDRADHPTLLQQRISQSIYGGKANKPGVDVDYNVETPFNEEQQISSAQVYTTPVSDSISDIIGHPPGWLLRSGITILALVTMIILGMSHLIQYPDKLVATGFITTEIPPVAIVSQSQSIIEQLYVTNGQDVSPGDDILLLRSTAERADVDYLADWIRGHSGDNYSILTDQLILGPIQGNYAQLLLSLNEYQEIRGHKSASQQILTIDNELENITALNRTIDIENEHYEIEQQLALSALERSKLLYADDLIAKVELEEAERSYEQFVRQLQTTTKSQVQNNIRVEQLNLESQQIAEQRITDLRNYRFRINQLLVTISEQIDNWYIQHVVRSDLDGTIELAEYIEPKYTLSAGKHITYVIPPESSDRKILKSKLPIAGSGKVRPGTKSIIKLDNYPYKEYGVITAEITDIAAIPTITETGGYYDITLELPSSIVTDYQHTIPYKPNMTTSVEIITEDKSILERITEQLTDLIN